MSPNDYPHGSDRPQDVTSSGPIQIAEQADVVVPRPATPDDPGATDDVHQRLDQMQQQLARLEPSESSPGQPAPQPDQFVPREPASLEEAQLTARQVDALILKYLLHSGAVAGRKIAEQVGLAYKLVNQLLGHLKADRLIAHKSTSQLHDYIYELTDVGRERAQNFAAQSTYFGAAPVSLRDYIAGVRAQSVANRRPSITDLCKAFSDLSLDVEMIAQLGQALHAGGGLFLFGAPGNGKTSIAQRITQAYPQELWIPRAIGASGEIVRIYDQSNHQAIPEPTGDDLRNRPSYDMRWIRIRRPTIIVGGELAMHNLEITNNRITGISEAPLQLKSNGGTLVIDDFGRQKMSIRELLNRWIIPLENGYDFLELASGRRIQVPFDQMIVFSTNLEPTDLVDEAFLRRIPYKIEVRNPTEAEYRQLFLELSKRLEMDCSAESVDYLIDHHYKRVDRPMRFCHPRDLVRQIYIYCSFCGQPPTVTPKAIDSAVKTYFAVM